MNALAALLDYDSGKNSLKYDGVNQQTQLDFYERQAMDLLASSL